MRSTFARAQREPASHECVSTQILAFGRFKRLITDNSKLTTQNLDSLEPSSRPHVVIVGGGFGGLYAVRALRRAEVTVTLVDRTNHHVFQPLLYQVATASLSPGDITAPIRWVLRRQRNATVLLAEVVALDLQRQTVALDDGKELSFDFLVLAPGSRHSYFGHDEW
jgi:NADH:ubiquinone reductase (H+-translocating)